MSARLYPLVDAALLRGVLTYDPATGLLAWTHPRGNRRSGSTAGRPHSNGYVMITVLGHTTFAHRVAWALMVGEWPQHQVDHVNGVRTDNRWTNLRAATQRQNCWNRPAKVGQYKGLTLRGDGKYQVMAGGQYVGRFSTDAEAARAYNAAAQRLGGEFAWLNEVSE